MAVNDFDSVRVDLAPDETYRAHSIPADAEIECCRAHGPDNRPLTPADFARMKRTPQVKIIRRALGLSQDDFAARYHIPIGTLRDWEQGRAVPDQAARAYLTVIARDPEAVRKALDARSGRTG